MRAANRPSASSAADPSPSSAEAAVRAVLDEAEAALRAGDWPRYAAVWAHAPWIELLHPAQGEWLTGWDAVGPAYRALLTGGARLDAERRELRVRVAPAGETAWAVSETVVRPSDAGAPAVTLWITYVLERIDGRWRLVHGHASVPTARVPARDGG